MFLWSVLGITSNIKNYSFEAIMGNRFLLFEIGYKKMYFERKKTDKSRGVNSCQNKKISTFQDRY